MNSTGYYTRLQWEWNEKSENGPLSCSGVFIVYKFNLSIFNRFLRPKNELIHSWPFHNLTILVTSIWETKDRFGSCEYFFAIPQVK